MEFGPRALSILVVFPLLAMPLTAIGQAKEQAAAPAEILVPEGTRIRAMFPESVSASGLRPGSTVELEVLENVQHPPATTVLIPKRARLLGRVVKVKPPEKTSDWLALRTKYWEISIWVFRAEWKGGYANLYAAIEEFTLPPPTDIRADFKGETIRISSDTKPSLVGGMIRVFVEGLDISGSFVSLEQFSPQAAAEQGEPDAQFRLGLMYHRGDGVPQDYAQAAKWFGKAAEQGLSNAQNNLGVMYATGQGVSRDNVAAYTWFTLAAPTQPDKNQRNLQLLEKRMTPEQIAEGKHRAEEWLKQHPPSY